MGEYDKSKINELTKEYGFIRDSLEKILRLKEILIFLNSAELLREHLALKGGTAINLCIFNLPRLSVDIDMDYVPNDTHEVMFNVRNKITELINEYMKKEDYYLLQSSRFSHSLDSFHFQYINASGNKDMIKIEINYSLRAHLFEPIETNILPDFLNDGEKLRILHPIEIFAAKGNALINRAAARDLYDWNNMIQARLFQNDLNLFRKCFVFYKTISSSYLDVNDFFNIDELDLIQFSMIKRDLFPMLSKIEHFDLENKKKEAKKYILNLLDLTDKETEYLQCFANKTYKPNLLFEDTDIVERIENHPIAIWKCD